MAKLKAIKDLFSGHAEHYSKYRPEYPEALYHRLFKEVKIKEQAWDCATGNGQVAGFLSDHFKSVVATDISQKQITHAVKKRNIRYLVTRSEKTPFDDNSFDLITVGQAIHWFDLPAFYSEATRVGKPGALIAVWAYGLVEINIKIDVIVRHFYDVVIGPYWDFERKYVDDKYESLSFPFEEINVEEDFFIHKKDSLDELIGYINSWSSVNKYRQKHNRNPVDQLVVDLKKVWPENETKPTVTPIFVKMGIVEK